MNYNTRINELQCLADIDESMDYEVDYSGIYTDGAKFYFIATSGCSCWDGDDYDESVYNSFEDLKKELIADDVSRFNPSLSGARYLIETAERILGVPKQEESHDLSIIEWLSSNSG